MDAHDSKNPVAHSARWHDRLQDSVDGALDAKAQAELNAHLPTCELCRTEQARLLALNTLLIKSVGPAPALSPDFSARVFTRIDEQEQTRRAAAKLLAERDFRKRLEALRFDWRGFGQRHLGSVIAGATTVAAVGATFGATWPALRGQLLSAFPSLASMQLSMTTATALTISLSVAAGSVWYLSTKTR